MSRNGRRATQRAAALFSRLHSSIRMLCLLMIGVIALGVAANAAPAKRKVGRPSGPAPIALEQIVAVGTSVFALAADHQGVYEWSEHQENWRKVKGAAQKLYAGGGNVYAIEAGHSGAGDISKYNAKTGGWRRIGGPGATFAATSKHLYGVSPDHSGLWQYSGRGDIWKKVGDRSENLYAGPDDAVYVSNPDDKKIFKYDGKWTPRGDAKATVAVTDNNLYALTPDRQAVVEYDSKKKKWNPVGGPAADILASNTLYKVEHGTGALWKYNGRPYKWNVLSDRAAAFVTSGDHLYRLAPDRRSVQKYSGDGATKEWRNLGSPAVPATYTEKTARLAGLTQLGPEATADWLQTIDAHRRGVPDPYEFRWTNNECNFPARNRIAGYDFTTACVRHDFGYRNYRDLHGEKNFRSNPNGKARVDEIFLQDMNNVCEQQGRQPTLQMPFDFAACKKAAKTFYHGVKYGEPALKFITDPNPFLPSSKEWVKGFLNWPGTGR
ncbi:phospholipase A2 [Streptomyces sp. NPDC091371]|uniref:phospholipase A2 n=1 Tax=Streptomyces sp. NPDC091371 TaxID=3155303 RepID=UPI0034233F64